MSTALPTHEVVAVFPAEIKAGVVRLPVGRLGKMLALVGTKAAMTALMAALVEGGVDAPPPRVVAEPPAPPAPRQQWRKGLAGPEYWARLRGLYARSIAEPTKPIREIAREAGMSLAVVYGAFRRIREGSAPYPQLPKRAPFSKPNGKLL